MAQTLATAKELIASEESLAQLKDWIQYLQEENSEQQSLIKAHKRKIDELSFPSHLRRKKNTDCRGGAKWPPCTIQIICEMHVNDTSPSAIPANIQMM
eukprot:2262586-Ditylum_brightwellii.AAC.1